MWHSRNITKNRKVSYHFAPPIFHVFLNHFLTDNPISMKFAPLMSVKVIYMCIKFG
jgi:hypothetical protein